jgi:hypothetical protein
MPCEKDHRRGRLLGVQRCRDGTFADQIVKGLPSPVGSQSFEGDNPPPGALRKALAGDERTIPRMVRRDQLYRLRENRSSGFNEAHPLTCRAEPVYCPEPVKHARCIRPIRKNAVPEHRHAGRNFHQVACLESAPYVLGDQSGLLSECAGEAKEIWWVAGAPPRISSRDAIQQDARAKNRRGREGSEGDGRERFREVEIPTNLHADPGLLPAVPASTETRRHITEACPVHDLGLMRQPGTGGRREIKMAESIHRPGRGEERCG